MLDVLPAKMQPTERTWRNGTSYIRKPASVNDKRYEPILVRERSLHEPSVALSLYESLIADITYTTLPLPLQLNATAAKKSSSVSAKPPQDPWRYLGKGHYGHHVGFYDEDTADLDPITPVDAAAKRHDEEYGQIQESYGTSAHDSNDSWEVARRWFWNYGKIHDRRSAFMHAEFIYSDLALAGRSILNIGAGLFDGSYDLTFTHGPQGWGNLISDLVVGSLVVAYGVISASVHVIGFALSIVYQIGVGIGQMGQSLGHMFSDAGGSISRNAKHFGGNVSREWKNAGGAISSGWKSAGGKISSGWKNATGGIKL